MYRVSEFLGSPIALAWQIMELLESEKTRELKLELKDSQVRWLNY